MYTNDLVITEAWLVSHNSIVSMTRNLESPREGKWLRSDINDVIKE